MAKIGAGTLEELLSKFETPFDEKLIVGYDKADDASVYKLSDDLALINTVDFFPPVCDDPYLYGQIAAANALSDVYAMGGTPKLALNLFCVTNEMSREQTEGILHGGYDKAMEANCIITGGHTITAKEPVYGLAVSGFVNPSRILKNTGAEQGDRLILTKPLGTGIMLTADKAGAELVTADEMRPVYENMALLNKTAAEIMKKFDVHGCTDITGFALAGHAMEMANGSGCTLRIYSGSIPYYPAAFRLAEMGIIPVGAYNNRNYAEKNIKFADSVPLALQDIIFDPQTSGGLLIATKQADELLSALEDAGINAAVIGEATAKTDSALEVI